MFFEKNVYSGIIWFKSELKVELSYYVIIWKRSCFKWAEKQALQMQSADYTHNKIILGDLHGECLAFCCIQCRHYKKILPYRWSLRGYSTGNTLVKLTMTSSTNGNKIIKILTFWYSVKLIPITYIKQQLLQQNVKLLLLVCLI